VTLAAGAIYFAGVRRRMTSQRVAALGFLVGRAVVAAALTTTSSRRRRLAPPRFRGESGSRSQWCTAAAHGLKRYSRRRNSPALRGPFSTARPLDTSDRHASNTAHGISPM